MVHTKILEGVLARFAAQAAQVSRFLVHRVGPQPVRREEGLFDLYRTAVARAFDPAARFIVTGSPHGAYYPRNFAWFYPDLLNPATIVDGADAANRCALVARSLVLMCQAPRASVHTTTLVSDLLAQDRRHQLLLGAIGLSSRCSRRAESAPDGAQL